MMPDTFSFDPVIAPVLIWVALALLVILAVFSGIRGLRGWFLRGIAGATVLAALANPLFQQNDVQTKPDIALIFVDRSSSQDVGDRPDQIQLALQDLEQKLANRPDTEVQTIELFDADDDGGTALMTTIMQTMDSIPQGQIAGVFLISDGQIHDATLLPEISAPTHLFLTGQQEDWDRRLVVLNAPAFAILGEPVELRVRIEDQGKAPVGATADLIVSMDGGPDQRFSLPVGQTMSVQLQLPHGGTNVLQMSTPQQQGEITDRNNGVVLRISGVRDRLRVLLVSGEPHAGERTWRNLLKSDNGVDLVHFTILRPPNKFDTAPLNELALIAFPTRELFLEKINDFDLIIFDRYKRRGLLPVSYFQNIADYVIDGGAVLVSAGPDFAGPESLYRSPLGNVIPARPTARVIEQGILPEISEVGNRHPITQDLHQSYPNWGRWMRQVEVTPTSGDVLMTGHEALPLLIVDRVGKGRVALLASDHAWLWDRGFEGGGPQRELLRRLSNWMMKEPELEEEALWTEPTAEGVRIVRRTIKDVPPGNSEVIVTDPTGNEQILPLQEVSPGRFETLLPPGPMGLYRFASGDLQAVGAVGPPAPREFNNTLATADLLQPLVDSQSGGVVRIADGLVRLRDVRSGRPAAGRGWVGLTPRDVVLKSSLSQRPILPVWAWLLLSASFLILAWFREGRG